MKKAFKIGGITVGSIIGLVVIFFCVILFAPWTGSGKAGDGDYSGWMTQDGNVGLDARLVDIAMPGAHDAFSYSITPSSPLDPATTGIFTSSIGKIGKNMLIRISITQTETIGDMLRGGVRYIDIRLTYCNGEWRVKHNYLGDTFESVLPEIADFLRENSGEVLIFDFQHVYDERTESKALDANGLAELTDMLDNAGILDYAFDFAGTSLSEVTYGMLTADRARSAVVMVIKTPTTDTRFLPYADSIRSEWFNSPDNAAVLDGIKGEHEFISQNPSAKERLRVMQGVVTLNDLSAIIRRWSIVSAAKNFNKALISDSDFDNYLQSTPIVMVDCPTTKYGDYQTKLMQKIIAFNRAAQ